VSDHHRRWGRVAEGESGRAADGGCDPLRRSRSLGNQSNTDAKRWDMDLS